MCGRRFRGARLRYVWFSRSWSHWLSTGGHLSILFLRALECCLKQASICCVIQKRRCGKRKRVRRDVIETGEAVGALSELANRMARVSAVGTPSETSAATFHTQLLSEPMLGWSFISALTVTRNRKNHSEAKARRNQIGGSVGRELGETHCSDWRTP